MRRPAPGQPSLIDVSPPAPHEWPRLTETVRGGSVSPSCCQRCPAVEELARWQEHDEHDRPEHRVIVLCRDCSARVIDRHPRLYRRLDRNEPWPGCMAICEGCLHRDGVRCTHPAAKANGGEGVALTIVRSVMHIKGRGISGPYVTYRSPASDCDRREPSPFYPIRPAVHAAEGGDP